jgi:hypothetical protein
MQWFMLCVLACVLTLLLGQAAVWSIVGSVATWLAALMLAGLPIAIVVVLCQMEAV